MNCMEFKLFGDVSAEDFLPLVNDETVRKHLIDHPPFDAASVRVWMDDKIRIDMLPGCRVRALVIDGALVGWCGIQPDGEGVEIAIVIATAGWGGGDCHLQGDDGVGAKHGPSGGALSSAGHPPRIPVPRQTIHQGEEDDPVGAWLHHVLPQRRTMVCGLMADNQCVASAWSAAR